MILAISVLIVAGLAWYTTTSQKKFTNVTGRVLFVPDYFADGDGTSDDPYIISEPEHLKNLAWLQYMGYFNKAKDGTIPTTYFKVVPKDGSTTLNMTGWVLPPIGTSENPFVGNFNGNGVTIEGLTTANPSNRDAYVDNNGKVHTPDILTSVTGVEIIGMFGVVGYTEEGKQTHTYSSQANQVKNFHISNANVKTQTSSSLVGIGAGYVNGTLENIGVVDSSITDLVGASALSSDDYTDKLSDYSLVGFCEEEYLDSTQIRTVEISQPKREYSQESEVEGGGTAWGNSIYMRDFYTRMSSIKEDLASAVKYYSSSVEYQYEEEGYSELEVPAGATEYSNSYITNYTNNTAGTGSATFTEESGQSIFAAEDFYLFGYKEFNIDGLNIVREIYNVYYKTNAITIKSDDYYLNAQIDSSGASIVSSKKNPTGWEFYDKDNKQGTLSTSSGDSTYYLNMDSNKNLVLGTSQASATYWYYTDSEIYCTNGSGTYYYIQYNASTAKWGIKEEVSSTYYISQGGNYLTYDGASGVKNSTSTSQATKWTFNSDNTIYTNTGDYLLADGTTLSVSSGSKTTFTLYSEGSNIGLESGIYRMVYADSAWKMIEKTIKGYLFSDTWWGTRYYLTFNGSSITKTTDKNSASIWSNDSNNDIENYHKWYTTYNGNKYYLTRGTASKPRYYIALTDYNSAYEFRVNNDTLFYYNSGSGDNHYITIHEWNGSFMITIGSSSGSEYEKVYKSEANLTRTVTNNPNASKLTVTEIKDKTKYYQKIADVKNYYTTPDTYVPISVNSDSPYGVKIDNTGYFVSGASNMGNAGSRADYLTDAGDLRVTSNSQTAGWLQYSVSGTFGMSFDEEELEVVTPQKQSNGSAVYVRISDSYNQSHSPGILNSIGYRYENKVDYKTIGLERYYTARENINTLFSSSTTMYGLRFNAGNVSPSNKFVARNISIMKKAVKQTYPYYELLRDSINFNVQSPGYINMFSATYYTETSTFYSLHEVFRDENNKIITTRAISKVYKIDSTHFFYKFTDGTYRLADGTVTSTAPYSEAEMLEMLAFDMDWMINPNGGYITGSRGLSSHSDAGELLEYTLYYFEIPLMVGEYALGPSGKGASAHLVYLDIGANAQAITKTTTVEVKKEITDTYVCPKGIKFQESTSDSLSNITNDASVGLAAGGTAGTTVTYDRAGDTVTATKRDGNVATYVADGVTVKNVGDTDSMTLGPADTKSTAVSTTHYIKKNADAGTTLEETTTVVTEVVENGVLKSRTKTVDGTSVTPTDADAINQGTIGLKYHYYIPAGDMIRTITLARLTGTDADEDIVARYEIFEESETNDFNIYIDTLLDTMNTSLINKRLPKNYEYITHNSTYIPGLKSKEPTIVEGSEDEEAAS